MDHHRRRSDCGLVLFRTVFAGLDWHTTAKCPFFLHLLHVAPRALHFPWCGVCCPQYRHTSIVDLFRAGCSLMSVRNGAVVVGNNSPLELFGQSV